MTSRNIDQYIGELGTTLGEELLKPTRIYYSPLTELIDEFDIKGISHITGGGFYENIPRMLPRDLACIIDTNNISIPPIFKLIQELAKWGNISEKEMYSTFNMGVGIVMVAKEEDVGSIINFLKARNEEAYIIGSVVKGNGGLSICRR